MNKSPEFNSFLQQALSKDLLFACFSYPGSSDLHFLCQTSVKILTRREVKDSTLCGFIFQPFDIEQDGIWINNDIYYNNSTDLFPDLPSINYNRQFNSQIEDSLDKKSYLTDVNELIKSIKNNVAKKVVFTRTQNIELSRNNLIDVFFRLNHDHNDAFVFLVNLPGKVAWIGATPEILLKEHNKECETMALAATRASGENDEKWNEKEIAEQSYVANYIEKILSDKNIKFIKSELLEKKLNSGIKHLC